MQRAQRLTTDDAASILGFSASTLRQWRKGQKEWRPGLGPWFYSVNGRVFYTHESLEDWERLCGSGKRQLPTVCDSDRYPGASFDGERQTYSI